MIGGGIAALAGGGGGIGIDIVAHDRASAVLNRVSGNVDAAGSKWDKWKGRAQVAAVAAGAAVVKFGIDSMRAFADAEKSQRVLEDAYARFPAIQDVPIAKMREYAQALQSKTKFDGDEINAMQGKLAAYKLTGSQIQELTPLILDYAAKTGKDLPTAVEDAGKALMGQGRSLKAIGINFKDAGSTGANFTQLMGGLRTQVGGFAEKEGASAEGKLAILKNKFGDLQESIGSRLMPAAQAFTDWLIKGVDWIGQNEGKVKVLGIAFGALAVTLGVAKLALLAQSAAAGLHAAWSGIIAVKTAAWAAAQWVLNAAMSANPIGLVVLAVAALAAGIIWVATQTKFFQTAWKVATDAIGAAWRWLWNSIIAPIIRFILNGFANMVGGIASFLRALSNIPGFGWAKTAADNMDGAARKAREMAAGIRDIPANKTVLIQLKGQISDTALRILNASRTGKARAIMEGRAAGGPTKAGQPYLVGEKGPEIHVSDRDGYIIPANETARIMAGAGRRRGLSGDAGPAEYFGTVVLVLDGREVHRSLLRLKRTEGGKGLGLG